MVPDYIAMAGPVFFVLILVEMIVGSRRGVSYYRVNDAINDISTGLLMQLMMLFGKGLLVAGYLWIYENFRLVDFSSNHAGIWIGCFLGVDFAYYWFHRLSHEVNFLWAAHVVHHQSEDYNLAVALRQSTLQPILGSVFYWPLALIGFPPLVFITCSSFNTLYQFWLHTQTIGSLGPLEEVFVTPSHHRVHHGRNPLYLDRNHGGTFIIWDRLFGTFEREGETVVYGITTPLRSWNPIWANLHYWLELFRTASATRRPIDKLRTFIAPPGWYPEDQGGVVAPPTVSSHSAKFDRPYPEGLVGYALFQFGLLVALTIGLGFVGESLGLSATLAGVGLISWGVLNLGGLFDGRAWSFGSEAARVVAAPLLSLAFLSGPSSWVVGGLFALGAVAFAVRLLGIRESLGANTIAAMDAESI
jgi:sterol desaturase/sphingolipid hydroxylase (fatty acid hydroxylase superfamily)